jgi:hypothetical protein
MRLERCAGRPDHDADGLLLEALLIGGDDRVDLLLKVSPGRPELIACWSAASNPRGSACPRAAGAVTAESSRSWAILRWY